MGYGSNGFNSNGSCMNINNQISSRPSIRLYPGVSSGGSFADFAGGGQAVPMSKGVQASRILKQVQQQKDSSSNLAAGRSAAAPAGGVLPHESLDKSLKRRTVIDAGQPEVENYGIGHRNLPDRHAPQALGGEVEAGYGIGNRAVDHCNSNHTRQVRHTGPSEGTSLCFGDESAPQQRSARRRGGHAPMGAPDWMGGETAAPAAKCHGRKVIDCSPPTSDLEPNFPPQHQTSGHVAPPMTRDEFDAFKAAEAKAKAAEAQSHYGIGNRVLEDRHAPQPLGGEVEAGYGLGNRNVSQKAPLVVPGLEAAYGSPTGRSTDPQSAAGVRRNRASGDRFQLGHEHAGESSDGDKSRMRQEAQQRMKARPF